MWDWKGGKRVRVSCGEEGVRWVGLGSVGSVGSVGELGVLAFLGRMKVRREERERILDGIFGGEGFFLIWGFGWGFFRFGSVVCAFSLSCCSCCRAVVFAFHGFSPIYYDFWSSVFHFFFYHVLSFMVFL